ncbi:hypothetical protein BDV38DRAFT_257206 [Aspergillus pseudotamarii]|uniref:Uncharacterized protein n=1 Tax=Aspergillus pseudotamarii TaxID=132259 RepID=A0A5N6SJB1_ASPPS|nr:uncharacterized protein BDV38DRAFT_257206 [Aspergillus pseudotamarii]KAE8133840.1 hypothetical protein BDV38DRAFT_257206 [Aspergillus pseudotamarii]
MPGKIKRITELQQVSIANAVARGMYTVCLLVINACRAVFLKQSRRSMGQLLL